MNIVILTDSYYPEMSACSSCMDRFIQSLKKSHSIDIINYLNRYQFEPYNDSSINVHYVYDFLWKLRIRSQDSIRNGKHIKFNKFIIKLFKIRTFLLSLVLYPSAQKWRIKAYCNELERLYKEKPIDIVISISGPICIAFSLVDFKKKNPDVKWINWFMDPFTYQQSQYKHIIFKKHRRRTNYIREKEVYDLADYNLFTEELYNLALSEFKQPLKKTYKVKYVLSPIPTKKTFAQKSIHSESSLIYAGMLFKDKRNPSHCLSILSKVRDIHFDIYVNYSNCEDIISKYLSKFIKRFPSVDRQRYCEMISNEYDILVNIGNNVTLQIPSKMMELLSTGRPILNFYQQKDIHYEMIEKYPLGLNIGKDDSDAVEKIEIFCKEMKGKKLSFEEVEKLYPECTLSAQLSLFEELIMR